MSGQLLQFAGSLIAVSLLVLIAWSLGLGRSARLASEDEARELADNAICGLEVADIALDENLRGALLRDTIGRIILLAPHGAHFAARLLDAKASIRRDGARLTITTGERRFPPVTLRLGEAAGTWEERLAALKG